MPLINLDYNLEDVSSTFEALPEASYLCRIKDADLVESSTKKPMLKFVWEVFDGEFVGRKLFDNVLLETDWKVKQYCELAGIESGSTLNTEDFKGVEGALNVKVGEYNNKPNNNIDSIEPA